MIRRPPSTTRGPYATLFRSFLYAAVGVGFSNLVVTIFNSAIDRQRPFWTLEDVNVLFYRPTDPSFPSNAAAFAFALAAGVLLVRPRWGLLIGLGATLFSFARVYAGRSEERRVG